MMKRRTVQWLLAFTALSLLSSSLMQRYMGNVMAEPSTDFFDYYFEAAIVSAHPRANMYSPALGGNPQLRWAPPDSELYQRAEAAGFNGTNLYLYPPLLADLLIPLSRVSPHHAATLWRGLNLLLVAFAILLVASWMKIPLVSAECALLLFAAYAFWPVHEAISLGQISIVLLALFAVAIVAYAEGKIAISAISLSLATWLKVTPILIVPVFLIWYGREDRRWLRWFAATTAAIGIFVVLLNGFQNFFRSLKVLVGMGGGVPALGNKSISSAIAWMRYGHPATIPEARILINLPQSPTFHVIERLASLGFYFLCLWLVWRGKKNRGLHSGRHRAVVLAVFVVVILLASPVAWRHGYSGGLVLISMLWVRALRAPETRALRVWLLALTTICTGSLVFDLVAQFRMSGAVQVLFASVWLACCVLLCLDVLWHHVSETTLITSGVFE